VEALLRPADSVEALERFGDYTVTEVLGQGGMGLVFKAFDPGLRRWVAIKVLAPNMASDPVARQRFAREARAAAAARHPHVITIHAVSEADGLPYFVMEYVAGGSLQSYLDRHASPDWRTVARLGAEIASGLAAAHAQGLIHRDIKPSNILLHTEGQAARPGPAKISDLGVARAADEARLTQTGIVPGTPMYMPSEQALSEPLDARADLFSFGSVLYALCTGHEPFPGGAAMAVLRQVCEATPRPIHELNPAIPAWLVGLVERLHAKRPADRFASAAEVAELIRYNLEHPEELRPVPPVRPQVPARTGRRRYLLAVGLAAILPVAGLLVSESLHWTHLFGHISPSELPASLARPRLTLRGHRGGVWSVAFAPAGQTLVTGSDDATLRFWDATTGRQKAERSGHDSVVLVVAFAHSGKFLATGGGNGVLRLWDPGSGDELPSLPHHGGGIRRAPLSPDDRMVALGKNTQGVELWELERRQPLRSLPGNLGTVLAMAFAPDGRTLATGDATGHIRLWDPATDEERARLRGDPLGVRALAFTPDSQTLAWAGSGDKDVKLWDVATRQRLATLSGYEIGAQNVAISPDGRLLATGSRDGVVRLWNLHSLRPVATLQAHQGSVWAVAFSPDGHTLATASEDRLSKLWDLGSLADGTPGCPCQPPPVLFPRRKPLSASFLCPAQSESCARRVWKAPLQVNTPLLGRGGHALHSGVGP
jgi:WD40 repeat protein